MSSLASASPNTAWRAGIVGMGGLLIAGAALIPALYAVNLVVVSVLAVALVCGWSLEGLLAAFLVSSALVHLLKRVIFLFGPQPQELYYGVQAIPGLLLLVLAMIALRRQSSVAPPLSAVLLLGYLAVALAGTLASASQNTWAAVGGAIHQQLLPIVLYFLAYTLHAAEIRKPLIALSVLGTISTVYGLVQLTGGPTPIDRAWAEHVHSYSIQGGKVLAYLEGTNPEFRGYSFYADPLTWGLLLLAVVTAAAIARHLRFIPVRFWRLVLAAALAGLVAAMTRTSWIGLLVMSGVYLMLGNKRLWRPRLLFLLSVGLFALTVGGGNYLYREFFLTRRVPVYENPILKRYATLGTVEARITAWDEFRSALSAASLIGQGNSVIPQLKLQPGIEGRPGAGLVHNVAVQLITQNGILGLLLYFLFYFQWLKEAAANLRQAASDAHRRCLRWVIGYAIGNLVTGYWNGNCYMTYYYWILLGLGSGVSLREGRRRVPVGNIPLATRTRLEEPAIFFPARP